MICKNCGKELDDGTAFCSSCGAKAEEILDDNNSSAEPSIAETPADSVAKAKEDKKNLIAGLVFVIVVIVIIIFVFSAIFGDDTANNTASKKDYLSAAETIVSNQLKAPSSAIYSNEKIEAQDDYGRTIVSLTVESQNSFGGYVTNTWYVLIESYDKKKDTFTYNQLTGMYMSEFGDSLADTYIKKLKESTDWNEPKDE